LQLNLFKFNFPSRSKSSLLYIRNVTRALACSREKGPNPFFSIRKPYVIIERTRRIMSNFIFRIRTKLKFAALCWSALSWLRFSLTLNLMPTHIFQKKTPLLLRACDISEARAQYRGGLTLDLSFFFAALLNETEAIKFGALACSTHSAAALMKKCSRPLSLNWPCIAENFHITSLFPPCGGARQHFSRRL
jgi:hypothetical protein